MHMAYWSFWSTYVRVAGGRSAPGEVLAASWRAIGARCQRSSRRAADRSRAGARRHSTRADGAERSFAAVTAVTIKLGEISYTMRRLLYSCTSYVRLYLAVARTHRGGACGQRVRGSGCVVVWSVRVRPPPPGARGVCSLYLSMPAVCACGIRSHLTTT